MDVINFVTTDAGGLCLLVIIAAMTLTAGNIRVFAPQGKCRLAVIKLGLAPTIGAMTILTLFSLTSFMHIIGTMTLHTGVRCVAHFLGAVMALGAGHLPVQTL